VKVREANPELATEDFVLVLGAASDIDLLANRETPGMPAEIAGLCGNFG
jgi:hypothetical protein